MYMCSGLWPCLLSSTAPNLFSMWQTPSLILHLPLELIFTIWFMNIEPALSLTFVPWQCSPATGCGWQVRIVRCQDPASGIVYSGCDDATPVEPCCPLDERPKCFKMCNCEGMMWNGPLKQFSLLNVFVSQGTSAYTVSLEYMSLILLLVLIINWLC